MDEAYVLLEGIPDTATLSEIVNFLEGCHIVGGIHGITIPQTSEGKHSRKCYVKLPVSDVENAKKQDGKHLYLKFGRVNVKPSSIEERDGDISLFGEYIRGHSKGSHANWRRHTTDSYFLLLSDVPPTAKIFDIAKFLGCSRIESMKVIKNKMNRHSRKCYVEVSCHTDFMNAQIKDGTNMYIRASKINVKDSSEMEMREEDFEEYKGIPFPEAYDFVHKGPHEHSDSKVEVVGSYMLVERQVKNIGKPSFNKYQPWDGHDMDLNEGYVNYVYEFKEFPRYSALKELLTWMEHEKGDVDNPYNKINAQSKVDFVCRRGVLRKIGFTLCATRGSWNCEVVRHNNIIYMSDSIKRTPITIETSILHDYWDGRFHRYMSEGGDLPYLVTECRFKDLVCLVSGEIDCKTEAGEYLEIAASYEDKFHLKIGSCWLHSYLGGNQKIALGLHSKYDGIINKVIEEKVDNVPEKFEDGNWSASEMLGFIHSILNTLKGRVLEGRSYTLKYEAEYHHGRGLYYIVEHPETPESNKLLNMIRGFNHF